jgi:chemotaxis signal transduction protein
VAQQSRQPQGEMAGKGGAAQQSRQPQGEMAGKGGAEASRCLIFEARGRRFALDIRFVEGIIPPRTVVPAPLAPSFIRGLINLRGKVVTVLSLGELLNLQVADGEGGAAQQSRQPHVEMAGEGGAMVVLRLPDISLAFGVEELVCIDVLESGPLGEQVLAEAAALPGVRAVFQHGGYPVHLLDLDELVALVGADDFMAAGGAGVGGRA